MYWLVLVTIPCNNHDFFKVTYHCTTLYFDIDNESDYFYIFCVSIYFLYPYFTSFFFAQRVVMTLTILYLKFLFVGRCSVWTLYLFRFNTFLIKSPLFFNKSYKLLFCPQSHQSDEYYLGIQLYWLVLVTIPCNNHDFFKGTYHCTTLYFDIDNESDYFYIFCVSIYFLYPYFTSFFFKFLQTPT